VCAETDAAAPRPQEARNLPPTEASEAAEASTASWLQGLVSYEADAAATCHQPEQEASS